MQKIKCHYLKILLLIVIPFCTNAQKPQSLINIGELICEYQTNPIAIDVPQPRLGWKLYAPARNTKQSAYEIRVGTNPASLARGKQLLWESGKVYSDQSIQIPYRGRTLTSR